MASSSYVSCGWLYDVFLSFRGEDVRKGFLSHVVKEFKSKGIEPFIDNDMERGKSVGPTLVGAIRQSKVAIVLLSRNYASSSWCLDELVEIMKCRDEDKQRVITIFYEVDPSHVRKQIGNFGNAFDETCVGKTEKVTHEWRQALKEVAGIAGYASTNWESEADLINDLASNIMGVLGSTPSNDFDDFVGIEPRVRKMKTMLSLQTKEVKVIGIWGPAGIGKTTAAKVLFNRVSPEFQLSTFLENIKGDFGRPCGNNDLLKLRFQEKLLSQIFKQKDIVVGHLRGAPQRLSDKKVLVVLDEVDSWWQLEEMAKTAWFGPGSMVIITTEDRKLFKALGLEANQIYAMKLPDMGEALEIFCLYAFGQKFPNYGFESLAREVTKLAGDLPLGLRVMGSYLRGMSKNEWVDALPSFRSSLHGEIESTLKLSYNVLSDKEKSLFLHIACFFVGFEVDSVKSILEKSYLNVNHGLQTLAYRSLISIEDGRVRMHSLLQQMGKEIVYGQSAEPGNRQFLTTSTTTEISDFFYENTVTGTLLGIKLLKLEEQGLIEKKTKKFEGEEIQISKTSFQGIRNLQFLDIDGGTLNTPEGFICFPEKLRYIHWNQCPMRFWPSTFSGKFLVELIMPKSNFEKLWEGIQPLPCLKRMNLDESPYLKKIPDLSKATSLEFLSLYGCVSFLELTSSIGNATKLRYCKLRGCCLLKELPSSFGRLINLEHLDLSDTEIEEIPPWIENLYGLQKLYMTECRNLKIVSPNISKLEKLMTIELCKGTGTGRCVGGETFSDDGSFKAVIEWGTELSSDWRLTSDLNIHYILPICLPEKALTSPISSLRLFSESVKTIPECIRRLSGLCELHITGFRRLTALPQLPCSLLSLDAHNCSFLRRINSSFQNPNICLNFGGCYNLNPKVRKLIQTSPCKYVLLPGEQVPSHFTHRDISCSLTIDLTPRHLPSSFRFKACVLLSKVSHSYLHVSCLVISKQKDLAVPYGSTQLHYMPCLYSSRNHLFIFEDSFSLNQDSPEAKDATFSELLFLFSVNNDWVVEGCGVRILEVLDGKETEYKEYIDINIEENNADNDDDEEDEGGDDSKRADDE